MCMLTSLLHAGDAFDATGHHTPRASSAMMRCAAMRDRLQPRGAEAVDRDTTRRVTGQSCAQCAQLAGDVPAGGAFQQAKRRGSRPPPRRDRCPRAELRAGSNAPASVARVGHVEGTLPALGQAGAGGGDNGNVGHGVRCPRGCQLKVLPCSASWSSKGAGSQTTASASGSAANRFRARTTLGSPTVSAYSIGPPRCRGNP